MTILLTAKMLPDDADEAVSVAATLGYEARPIGGVIGTDILVLFETLTIDEGSDGDANQEQFRQHITTVLTEHGIQHQVVSVAVDDSSMTKSTFTIRPIGVVDADAELEVRADNRRDFEQRLAALRHMFHGEEWPPPGLDGYEVSVEGLAAGDPDLQQPPFIPKHS